MKILVLTRAVYFFFAQRIYLMQPPGNWQKIYIVEWFYIECMYLSLMQPLLSYRVRCYTKEKNNHTKDVNHDLFILGIHCVQYLSVDFCFLAPPHICKPCDYISVFRGINLHKLVNEFYKNISICEMSLMFFF